MSPEVLLYKYPGISEQGVDFPRAKLFTIFRYLKVTVVL